MVTLQTGKLDISLFASVWQMDLNIQSTRTLVETSAAADTGSNFTADSLETYK